MVVLANSRKPKASFFAAKGHFEETFTFFDLGTSGASNQLLKATGVFKTHHLTRGHILSQVEFISKGYKSAFSKRGEARRGLIHISVSSISSKAIFSYFQLIATEA